MKTILVSTFFFLTLNLVAQDTLKTNIYLTNSGYSIWKSPGYVSNTKNIVPFAPVYPKNSIYRNGLKIFYRKK